MVILPPLNNEWRAMPLLRRSTAGFPQRRPGFESRSGRVGFVVDKVTLGQVHSEYFGFPCQFSLHRLLHIHHHLSSMAGTIGQLVADVPSGLSLSLNPPQETEKKNNYNKWRHHLTQHRCKKLRRIIQIPYEGLYWKKITTAPVLASSIRTVSPAITQQKYPVPISVCWLLPEKI
jgi:hypothetical protein